MHDQGFCLEEEIRERIAARNTADYRSTELFTSKILYRCSKLVLFNTVINAIVTYATYETWVINMQIQKKVFVFQRTILWKIFGTKKLNIACGELKLMNFINQEKEKILKQEGLPC
jgi:hypothetical protein